MRDSEEAENWRLIRTPLGELWSGRTRYAAAMYFYGRQAMSAEVLEVYRVCARLDADDPLAIMRDRRIGEEWIERMHGCRSGGSGRGSDTRRANAREARRRLVPWAIDRASAMECEMEVVLNADEAGSPARQIDARIAALGGWKGKTLARMRDLIRQADPEVVEAVKWRKPSNPAGVPVWERSGILCTGDAFKNYVKMTFARGGLLPDPSGVFNAGLEGNAMRAINIHEDDEIDEEAFKALVRAAVALNVSRTKKQASREG